MVNRIYPSQIQLNEANNSNVKTPFLDLHLNISNGFASIKIYEKKRDEVDLI